MKVTQRKIKLAMMWNGLQYERECVLKNKMELNFFGLPDRLESFRFWSRPVLVFLYNLSNVTSRFWFRRCGFWRFGLKFWYFRRCWERFDCEEQKRLSFSTYSSISDNRQKLSDLHSLLEEVKLVGTLVGLSKSVA